MCDYLATHAANEIEHNLYQLTEQDTRINPHINPHINIVRMNATRHRTVYDENRSPEHNKQPMSEFQNVFIRMLDIAKQGRVVHLDIHSIPGACGMYGVPRDTKAPVAVLDGPATGSYPERIATHLGNDAILCKLTAEHNDIYWLTKTARERDIPSVLLEFNERVHDEVDTIGVSRIARRLIDGIRSGQI